MNDPQPLSELGVGSLRNSLSFPGVQAVEADTVRRLLATLDARDQRIAELEQVRDGWMTECAKADDERDIASARLERIEAAARVAESLAETSLAHRDITGNDAIGAYVALGEVVEALRDALKKDGE